MYFTSPEAAKLCGCPLPLQTLFDRRGLLRYEQGAKRANRRDRMFDKMGLFSLALLASMRRGNPSKGVPPFAYEAISPLIKWVNERSEEEIAQAAENDMLLAYVPPPMEPCFLERGTPLPSHGHFGLVYEIKPMWERLDREVAKFQQVA